MSSIIIKIELTDTVNKDTKHLLVLEDINRKLKSIDYTRSKTEYILKSKYTITFHEDLLN